MTKMNIQDGYWSSNPEFIGAFSIRQELEVLSTEDLPPSKGWIINKIVSINGNKYLKLLGAYLKKVGKSSEDELSSDEIEKLYSKCEFK